jgi:hypothetical protein
MTIPAVGLDGRRQTVNTGISDLQTVWNVRSGLNVAALNCRSIRHAGLVENYSSYLVTHKRQLADTNRKLGREYRTKHGSSYRNAQDAYMTQVYNYFALPPALPAFCDEALAISRDAMLVPRGELGTFSAAALPRMEGVFENFFRSYEQYRADVLAWDAKYGSGGSGFGNTITGTGPTIRTGQPITPSIETVGAAPSTAAPAAALPAEAAPSVSTFPAPQPTSGPVFVSKPVVEPTADDDGGN